VFIIINIVVVDSDGRSEILFKKVVLIDIVVQITFLIIAGFAHLPAAAHR
jgi:hypothetical protein